MRQALKEFNWDWQLWAAMDSAAKLENGTRKEQEVMLFLGSSTSTKVKVKKTDDSAALDTSASGDDMAAAVGKTATDGPISRGYTEEIEHWAWCIRNTEPNDTDTKNLPRCRPEVALADAVIALTSNIAMQGQGKIEFKREWFDIDSDETPEGIAPRKAEKIT